MRNTISRATIAGLASLSRIGSLGPTSEPALPPQFMVGGGARLSAFHGGGGGVAWRLWHGACGMEACGEHGGVLHRVRFVP